MESITNNRIKFKDKNKKREGLKMLKVTQNTNLKNLKEFSKDKGRYKEKDTKSDKEMEKITDQETNIEKKKENIDEYIKDKNREKNKEIIKEKKNLKNNKSINNYILSDSETTTRGDTINDYNKKKFVYRKAINRKNFCFAINNFIPTIDNQSKHEKKNRPLSLNKLLKESNTENVRNTNNNFFKKQSNLLENYRANYNIKDINININNSINVYNNCRNYNEINNNNISYIFEKNEKLINIEDLLILDEKFNEVLLSIKIKHNTPNECFELLNSYQQSSLYNNFENYFKDNTSKNIIHTSIMYFIYNVIICYNFSFDYLFFNTCYQFLESILDLNHKSYLLLCQLILLKISSSSKDNIWVDKLRKLLRDNLKHIELNNKEYINFLMEQTNINYKNPNSNILLEIKFYSNQINKYLQLFLNSINNENELKKDFCTLFDNININNLSENVLLYFFKSKIIRVINQNASVAGIKSSSYKILLNENSIQVPYLKFHSLKKFSLVLDLDETLISFKLDPNEDNKGTIRFRPYLDSFLQKVKEKYELIVFTSGTKDYADPIEDAIEQDTKYFDARLYRQHTIACGKDIVKDISRIGRPLDKIIIVENMPQNYRLQKENGILIKSFYGEDIYDTALASLGDILIKIANEFNDVRIGIAKYKDEILDKVSTNFSKKNKNITLNK